MNTFLVILVITVIFILRGILTGGFKKKRSIDPGKELNELAIGMGKCLLKISDLESKIDSPFLLSDFKEEFFMLAYISRISILDKYDKNSNWMRDDTKIVIPLDIYRTRHETIKSGYEITIGKIIDLVKYDLEVSPIVEDILIRGESFDKFDNFIPTREKIRLRNNMYK